jgi:hypothetical protein
VLPGVDQCLANLRKLTEGPKKRSTLHEIRAGAYDVKDVHERESGFGYRQQPTSLLTGALN